jgi:hypothetical protein
MKQVKKVRKSFLRQKMRLHLPIIDHRARIFPTPTFQMKPQWIIEAKSRQLSIKIHNPKKI